MHRKSIIRADPRKSERSPRHLKNASCPSTYLVERWTRATGTWPKQEPRRVNAVHHKLSTGATRPPCRTSAGTPSRIATGRPSALRYYKHIHCCTIDRSGTPPTNATKPLVAPSRAHHFRSGPLRASVRVAYFPSSDLGNSLTVVLVNGPVAPLAFLGAVPDAASRTSRGTFFAAGGADRGRDRDFFGVEAAGVSVAWRGALVRLGACCAVGVDQGVLLGALAHGAFAHMCEGENMGLPLFLPAAIGFCNYASAAWSPWSLVLRRAGCGSDAIAGRRTRASLDRSPEAIRRWRSSVGARFCDRAWRPRPAASRSKNAIRSVSTRAGCVS